MLKAGKQIGDGRYVVNYGGFWVYDSGPQSFWRVWIARIVFTIVGLWPISLLVLLLVLVKYVL